VNDYNDAFVLTRKPRMPELIFNNTFSKDLYWETEQGEMWHLSRQSNHPNECFICQKHKYAMIYVDKYGNNEDLDEILDPEIIESVKYNLNTNDHCDDYVPIICGSVVNGGFKRKLQMLRSDYYSLISLSQSNVLVRSHI
jgi:hypothetical protein